MALFKKKATNVTKGNFKKKEEGFTEKQIEKMVEEVLANNQKMIELYEKLYEKEPTFWVLFYKSIQEPKQTIIFLANI